MTTMRATGRIEGRSSGAVRTQTFAACGVWRTNQVSAIVKVQCRMPGRVHRREHQNQELYSTATEDRGGLRSTATVIPEFCCLSPNDRGFHREIGTNFADYRAGARVLSARLNEAELKSGPSACRHGHAMVFLPNLQGRKRMHPVPVATEVGLAWREAARDAAAYREESQREEAQRKEILPV